MNFGSSKDLPAILFSKEGFHFKPFKTSETGKPSTDEESLTQLRLSVENPESPKAIFLDKLKEVRDLKHTYTTFILGWQEKLQDDSRLHGKFNIHGTDSNRFSCIHGDTLVKTSEGDITIKDLKDNFKGKKVITKEGWKDILNWIDKGKDQMYEVELEDGTTIKCTLDHIFITNQGDLSLRSILNKYRSTISNKPKLLKYEE